MGEYTGNEVTTMVNNIEIVNYQQLETQFSNALLAVDDIVLKNYLSKLDTMKIVPIDKESSKNALKDIRLFKITEMVYERNEFSAYKFASVFNTLANVDCTVFVIIDSDGQKTNFYMGIKGYDRERLSTTIKDTLKKSLIGQFPGVKIEDTYLIEDIRNLFINLKSEKSNVSSVSCIANSKDHEIDNNDSFVQGIEKLVVAMQGEKYTGVIIADSATKNIQDIKYNYEYIYSQLMPFAKTQVTYSKNDSFSKAIATCIGTSVSYTNTEGENEVESKTHGKTITEGTSESNFESISKQNLSSRLLQQTKVASKIGKILESTKTTGHATTHSTSESINDSETYSRGTNKSYSETTGNNKSRTNTEGITKSIGNALTINVENKTISDIIEKLDMQLKRIRDSESLGMWECSAYFMSKDNDVAEIAALTYKSLMHGENSGVELGAVNSWFCTNENDNDVELLKDYIFSISHPVFEYSLNNELLYLTPASMVSSNELAIHMGLPRKSVPGFPVIEHADFGKEVVSYNGIKRQKLIELGKIFNMGAETQNKTELDLQSLAMHTFITGATGSGKSNTVYKLLDELLSQNIKFMVIEPAKGEYKNVFGNDKYRTCNDVHVYGTNPQYTELLKINPFKFPKGIHVLEHIDRLIEIFNVCWPMYAAMPAVLKDAVLQAYENCGWDLIKSTNKFDDNLFPNFSDLLKELVNVIERSAYDQEVKSNYIGSLQTRVKSLTNGLNGQIFSSAEIDNSILFDGNVVVDLSRIGSVETKSLIMGILVMRLNEHRVTQNEGMNVPLKHVTVIEEAHNILKRTSTEQSMEGSNLAGKSVEMLSNAIAEMRTYGEGFIIADQSPNAVDISAIRNTNTKIIMRLPDEDDRVLAGKAAGLKDEQIDEIAKLPKGVAVVYQNDWLEAVLCKINKFEGKEIVYKCEATENNGVDEQSLKRNLVKFFINANPVEYQDKDIERLRAALLSLDLSARSKGFILPLLDRSNFDKTKRAKAVAEILKCEIELANSIKTAETLEALDKDLDTIVSDSVSNLEQVEILEISKMLMSNYFENKKELQSSLDIWLKHITGKESLV